MTKPSKTYNCLICDSARHTSSHCIKLHEHNTLFKLYSVEHPDFHSYTLKDLKIIAFVNPFQYNFDSATGMRPDMRTNKKLREDGYDPIPMTLSKNRMIKALTNRWSGRKTIIEKYNNPPSTTEECPVCYEPIQTHTWRYRSSEWQTDYSNNTIKTACSHHFCSKCWRNIKISHNYDYEVRTKKCPMCRQENTDRDISYQV